MSDRCWATEPVVVHVAASVSLAVQLEREARRAGAGVIRLDLSGSLVTVDTADAVRRDARAARIPGADGPALPRKRRACSAPSLHGCRHGRMTSTWTIRSRNRRRGAGGDGAMPRCGFPSRAPDPESVTACSVPASCCSTMWRNWTRWDRGRCSARGRRPIRCCSVSAPGRWCMPLLACWLGGFQRAKEIRRYIQDDPLPPV
jgi:hypothetical protein